MGDQKSLAGGAMNGWNFKPGSEGSPGNIGNIQTNLAGGPVMPRPTSAGGAMQINPIPQPFGGPQVPGNPGSFWGPGSTFYGSTPGSNLPPEIISGGGNAYLYGPGGWTAAGTNAKPPTTGPLPTPSYAGPNSIPGQALSPFIDPSQVTNLQNQLQAAFKADPNHPRADVTGVLNKFWGALPQTVPGTPPSGGYVPGYAVPQASAEYVPASAAQSLQQSLFAPDALKNKNLPGILQNWASGLGSMGPTGVTVPNLSGGGGTKGK